MARLKVDGYQTISAGILDPNQTIVVVVDMVKGFVSEGAMADPEIARIAPEICQLETYFAHHLYFQDWHEADCMEFASFPPHCLAHTTESELLDCFKEDARHQTIIRKNSTVRKTSKTKSTISAISCVNRISRISTTSIMNIRPVSITWI